MGIDVYLNWKNKSNAEQQAQYTGFSTESGDVGYLREAYHGGPYATQVLMPEGWDEKAQEEDGVAIPAKTLRARLPATILTATYRHHINYEQPNDRNRSGGKKDIVAALAHIFAHEVKDRSATDVAAHFNAEQLKQMETLIAKRQLPGYALAFVDFVILAETKEAETGEPCKVFVSA